MAPAREPIVDVIVPVHNQREVVEPCLASVLAARNQVAFELVVIDDASTDAALKASLARLARDRRITLLENGRNLGFNPRGEKSSWERSSSGPCPQLAFHSRANV
jgi:O-antigen biosynthesis protein